MSNRNARRKTDPEAERKAIRQASTDTLPRTTTITPEAREAAQRAWLAILHNRYPGKTFFIPSRDAGGRSKLITDDGAQ